MRVTYMLAITVLFSLLSLMFSLLKSPVPRIFCRSLLRSTSTKSAYSLLMDTPIVLRRLSDIANRYDLFLFDQFGVLHNGVEPIDGAIDMLEQLNKLKKTVVIVSNTSGRSKYAAKKLNDLGFLSECFDGGVVTSGEAAHEVRNSIYVCVYIYIYLIIHTHVCICIYTHTYVHICIYMY
jgi:hypothetical protein